MSTERGLTAVVVLLVLVAGFFASILYWMRSAGSAISSPLDQRLAAIEGAVARADATMREEFSLGRDESQKGAKSLREEITTLFGTLATSVRGSVTDLATGQNARLEDFAGRLNEAKTTAASDAKALRDEVSQNLKTLGDTLTQTLDQISRVQKERSARGAGERGSGPASSPLADRVPSAPHRGPRSLQPSDQFDLTCNAFFAVANMTLS
jgi:hypothetical protein